MTTTTAPAGTAARPQRRPTLDWLPALALVATAIGLAATGLVLAGDPADQIGAWLQIGVGAGLAAAALSRRTWSGGLVVGVGTSLGLVVGHLSDLLGPGTSTIGPAALVPVAVMLVLTTLGLLVLRRRRP